MRVLVVGGQGRMGTAARRAVESAEDLTLAGSVDLGDSVADAIRDASAEVVVDFTIPTAIRENLGLYVELGVHPVVGTTGIPAELLQDVIARSRQRGLGGLVAANFALGAVLMMELAARAAPYLKQVEIIESHHRGKLDAPSGTSLLTRDKIESSRGTGAEIPIHSVRVDGFLATQEVILGGSGERLTIRHDSIDRECFMPGVLLAIRRVRDLPEILVGLDRLLEV